MNSFYSRSELKQLGLNSYGHNVLISRKISIYNPNQIDIGSNVRIDDFSILSGRIKIGSYVHVSAYCAFYGHFDIELKDFSGTSPRTTIFSGTDDFSGEYLINPMVPKDLTKVTGGKVIINRFCQIGCNSVLLPGVKIGEGSVVGALSLVNRDIDEWGIYAGIPVRFIKYRKKDLLIKYESYFNSYKA